MGKYVTDQLQEITIQKLSKEMIKKKKLFLSIDYATVTFIVVTVWECRKENWQKDLLTRRHTFETQEIQTTDIHVTIPDMIVYERRTRTRQDRRSLITK